MLVTVFMNVTFLVKRQKTHPPPPQDHHGPTLPRLDLRPAPLPQSTRLLIYTISMHV